MWKVNKENLSKEVPTATYLNVSGCFETEIKKVQVKESQSSSAKALSFEVSTEKGTARFDLWFQNKLGEYIKFTTAMLDRLCAALKIDPNKFDTYTQVDNFGGAEYENTYIKDFEGKKIGIFLEHYVDQYNGKARDKFNCKGFFSIKTKKTVSEMINKQPVTRYKYWEKKFAESAVKTVDTSGDEVSSGVSYTVD